MGIIESIWAACDAVKSMEAEKKGIEMRKKFSLMMILAVALTLVANIASAEEFALKGEHEEAKGRIGTLEATVADLQAQVTELQGLVAALQGDLSTAQSDIGANTTAIATCTGDISTSQADIAALQAKTQYMRVEDGYLNYVAGPHVIFEGANLHVQSGAGETADEYTERGNLIIGYNEPPDDPICLRYGAHNLVVGLGHQFTSYGGFVAGINNAVHGWYSSVSGGGGNVAANHFSSVSGGAYNTADGLVSSISGGNGRSVSGEYDWAAGSLFEED